MKKQIIAALLAIGSTVTAQAEVHRLCKSNVESAASGTLQMKEIIQSGALSEIEVRFYSGGLAERGVQTAAFCAEMVATYDRWATASDVKEAAEDALAYYNSLIQQGK